jgi:hypothetical protein
MPEFEDEGVDLGEQLGGEVAAAAQPDSVAFLGFELLDPAGRVVGDDVEGGPGGSRGP